MGQSGSFRDSDFPDLVLRVDAERVEDGFNIFAVDTKGGGGYSKMSIKFLFNFRPADPKVCSGHMSMAICGSKFCIIGAGFDRKINKFPREFVQYDLTDWRNKNDFKPDDDVPKPIGSKPRPAVFVHQHRLYALAGMSYCTPLVNVPDIPDPAFEVYDPYHAPPCWKKLEDPPFMEYYNKATVPRRFLWGHKVVGTTLYVLLRGGSFPKDVYYTYSITDHEWKKIIVDKSDTFLANMTVYGHYCEWEAREDFVDLMGFHYNGKKVLAHDLRAHVDQSMIRKKHNVRVSPYDDYYVEHEYPFLVVHDLEEVKDSDGFVAHLADNIFCAVYFSMFEGKCRIHAVKFELRKEYKEGCDLVDTLSAKILESADHSFGDRRSFGTCDQWGKLYSKSLCPNGYTDDAAMDGKGKLYSKCLRPNGYTDGVVMNDKEFDMKTNMFPREFVQYDLTDWRNRNDFKPDDDVPKPIGSKPCPAIFVHGHRLYALASMSYCTPLVDVPDIPDPAFEVYDPKHAPPCWRRLKDPPFKEDYYQTTVNQRFLSGHKVVGTTLYVLLHDNFSSDVYYIYSITDDKWKTIFKVDESDTLLVNLTVYGHYCSREAREDFVDLMSFHYNGKKVLAHDLTAQVDESKLRKNHNVEDEYPFLVVHGLEDVKEPHSHGFVAHLAGNIFCAVYFTRVRDKYCINAIKFELCKKYKEGCDLVDTLSANILDSADYFMGDKRSFGPCKTMGQVVLYISVPQRLYTDDAVMNGK